MIVKKPWGSEAILLQTPGYVVKEIRINKGCRLSLQYHKEKRETLFLISGDGYIERNIIENSIDHIYTDNLSVERYQPLYMEPVYIDAGVVHRIGCYNIPTVFLEVSTTQLLDVVRIEDDFNRCN